MLAVFDIILASIFANSIPLLAIDCEPDTESNSLVPIDEDLFKRLENIK